jgi:hypothetical protein
VQRVPLVDITYDNSVSKAALVRLGQVLPDTVAEAVSCAEEPWHGPPAPGDIEIRFRSKGPWDVGELTCVVEVRTKLVAGRVHDRGRRAELIRSRLVEAVPNLGLVGVWLILHEGSWAQ